MPHKHLDSCGCGELDRRSFLKAAAGLGVLSFSLPFAPGLLRRAAADEAKRRSLVVIYLRGGMDAMNTLVPYGDPTYYEMRPTIAVPPADNDWGEGVIQLGKYFGFHPALRPLMPFYESGRLAPILCVGSPHNTRSHFDAQDFMEYAAPGLRTLKDGWLNRYLELRRTQVKKGAAAAAELPDGLRAIAMQGLLPRALRGRYPVLAVPSDDVLGQGEVLDLFGDIYGDAGGGEMDGGMMGGGGMTGEAPAPAGGEPTGGDGLAGSDWDSVLATGQVTLGTLERYKQIISSPAATENPAAAYPGGPLSVKLQRVAKVIHAGAGLEVACIDVPGWDHHAVEGGVTGTLARMLENLAGSLAAFMTDVGDRLADTAILVMTEFGRTCRENGNEGTDHGRGGCFFLMGGKTAGGKIHGTWPGLQPAALVENRDLAVTTDFRDVFAEVLVSHFEAELPRDFFPGYQPQRLKGLFG